MNEQIPVISEADALLITKANNAVTYTKDRQQFRLLLGLCRPGKEATSEEVRAFLLLFGEEIQETLDKALKAFVKSKT